MSENALSLPSFQGLDQTMTDVAGQLAPSSQRIYLNDAKHFAQWMQQHGLTPQTMTRSAMIAYRSYLATSSYSKPTKQRMFSVASRLMNEQYINGDITTKVTLEVKGFRTDTDESTHIALKKSQARDMLNAIDIKTNVGKRDHAMILILVKAGLRRAELVALNRSDIKMMDGHHVAVVHGKGDKRRIVKLRVDVWRVLDDYLQAIPGAPSDAPLFVRFLKGDRPTTKRLTDKAVELIVKKYAPEEASELTPHGLRATYATLALESGASLEQVQYSMGHKDPRTTERYQKRKLHLDKNAVDVLDF